MVWVCDTGQDLNGVVQWVKWAEDGQLKVGVNFVSGVLGISGLCSKGSKYINENVLLKHV